MCMLMKCNTVSQLTGIAYHTKALNGFGALQFAPSTPDRSRSRKQKKQKTILHCRPLPLCKPLRFVQFGREDCPAGEYLWLDMLRAADES